MAGERYGRIDCGYRSYRSEIGVRTVVVNREKIAEGAGSLSRISLKVKEE